MKSIQEKVVKRRLRNLEKHSVFSSVLEADRGFSGMFEVCSDEMKEELRMKKHSVKDTFNENIFDMLKNIQNALDSVPNYKIALDTGFSDGLVMAKNLMETGYNLDSLKNAIHNISETVGFAVYGKNYAAGFFDGLFAARYSDNNPFIQKWRKVLIQDMPNEAV